jgi:oligopeptide transport system substrate-binding protein
MSKQHKYVQRDMQEPLSTWRHVENLAALTWRAAQFGTVLASLGWLVACGSGGSTADGSHPADRGVASSIRTLRRGLPGEPQSLDPQRADDTYSFQVIKDLYEGLTAEDPSGGIVPGTAESWTIDQTGTVYTFKLRPDAKWSDGRPVVAEEFVAGLRRAVDPKTASGSAALLSVIKGASEITAGRKGVTELAVAAVGDSSIQIELEHPAPYILQILSQPISAPLHVRSDASSSTSPNARNEATNGPYVLAAHAPGSFIDLTRNPNYWDASNVAIEHVRYVNAESATTELRAYAAGQLDITFTIPMSDFPRILENFGSEVQSAPILGTLYLALNLSEPPLGRSKELRQALSMSVDRELIAERVLMGVTPAYALVAAGVAQYRPSTYEWSKWTRERQLALAKGLYATAGYSAQKPLHLRLYFNSDEGIKRVMMAIAGSWKQNLGVNCELVSDEFRVFLAGRKDRHRWDVTRLGWTADYDDPSSFLDLFAKNSSENDPGYTSNAFSQLIDEARVESHNDKRVDLLSQSEAVLLDDYPVIPIYFYTARRLVKPYLGGAHITPMNETYSKHLYWKGGA